MGEPKAKDVDNENEIDANSTPAGGEGNDAAKANKDARNTSNSSAAEDTGAVPGSGPSEIDAGKRVEIDLLTYEICLEIVDVIARRCKAKLPDQDTLLVAAPGAAAAIGRAQAFAATLAALRDQIKLLADNGSTEEILEKDKDSTGSSPFDFVTAGFDKASALVDSIKTLVEKFAVADIYDSRGVTIDPATLAAVVSGRCLRQELNPVVIAEGHMPALRHGTDSLLPSLIRETERLRNKKLADESAVKGADLLLERADAVIDGLRLPDAADVLNLLQLLDANPTAPLLTVQMLSAGGSYRTRTHIFTALGLGEKLSVSAGAAILFTLSERSAGKLLAGDLLFEASGHVCLPSTPKKRHIGNLRGSA